MGRLKAFSTTLGWVKMEAESTEAILKIAVQGLIGTFCNAVDYCLL